MKDILELFEFATNLELGDLGIIQDRTDESDLASKLECFCRICFHTSYPWYTIKKVSMFNDLVWRETEKPIVLFVFYDDSIETFLKEYNWILKKASVVIISKNEVETDYPFLEFDLSAEYLKHLESWQYIDIWDLAVAHERFYVEWSENFDWKYSRQCEILEYFNPGVMFSGITDPTFSMALDVYIDLVRLFEGDTLKNHQIIVESLKDAENITEDLQTLEKYKQQKLGSGEWVE